MITRNIACLESINSALRVRLSEVADYVGLFRLSRVSINSCCLILRNSQTRKEVPMKMVALYFNVAYSQKILLGSSQKTWICGHGIPWHEKKNMFWFQLRLREIEFYGGRTFNACAAKAVNRFICNFWLSKCICRNFCT